MNTTPCRGCGKPIVWGKTEDGKNIPLDPRPPCYKIAREPSEKGTECVRAFDVMVSHFATCPKANDFSGSNRSKP